MADQLFLKQYNLVLIRYAEIWLKSQKIKIRMLKYLMNNIKNILKRKGIPFNKYQMSKDSARIFFFFNNKDIPEAINVLKNAFGAHSISPAIRTSNKLKNITERTIEVGSEVLEENDTFALRVKRSGNHSFTSIEAAQIVGKAVIEGFPELNLKVDLTHPKKQIFIEIRGEFTYIFSEVIKSKWGGLPIEPQKKMLVMDIGRLNDLVAGFLLLRRGAEIYPILIDIKEDKSLNEIWFSNWRIVREYVPYNRFHLSIINVNHILNKIATDLEDQQYFCGICRLIRFEVMSKILNNPNFSLYVKIRASVDGSSLNCSSSCPDQVDLDTIANNSLVSKLPIFTPIIGFDTIKLKDLTWKISPNLVRIDYCPFKPKDQEFNAERLKDLYASLKIDAMIEESIEKGLDIRR
ncbi:MAG: THUMP domain-containing protein [Promethearchaeota archaeon]|jgi:thiamine biosynthesis protein ThiI